MRDRDDARERGEGIKTMKKRSMRKGDKGETKDGGGSVGDTQEGRVSVGDRRDGRGSVGDRRFCLLSFFVFPFFLVPFAFLFSCLLSFFSASFFFLLP